MWSRVIEIMLGFWLLASPFIFGFAEYETKVLASDLLCGLLVIVSGFLSYLNRTKQTHFLTLIIAFGLIIFGYSAGYPAPPPAQNHIIVGLLLAMFAIIPSRTNELPEAWRKFYTG
jgi:hypothetical protein